MSFMPKIEAGIGKSFLSLLSIFNFFAGIVALIGFLVIGEWLVIAVGLLMMFLMPKLYGFVVLPHIGLAALSLAAMKRRRTTLGMVLGLASALYNNAVITAWILDRRRLFRQRLPFGLGRKQHRHRAQHVN